MQSVDAGTKDLDSIIGRFGPEETMSCESGDKLRRDFEATTRALGAYSESLIGTDRTHKTRQKLERLREDNTAARRAFAEHKRDCPTCSNHRWLS